MSGRLPQVLGLRSPLCNRAPLGGRFPPEGFGLAVSGVSQSVPGAQEGTKGWRLGELWPLPCFIPPAE